MELDKLKEIWNDAGSENKSLPGDAVIMDMIGKSSKSPVARMIRNVLVELILIIILFGGVAVFYFIAFKGMFNSVAWLYIITGAIFVFYYYRKWKLLHEMQCVACRVKSNLQLQVRKLESYTRFYLLAGTALVPLLFILLGVLFYYKFPAGAFSFIFPPLYKSADGVILALVIWAVSLTIITALVYAGNRWYVNKLYGKHIGKLKQLLTQMEDE